MSHNRHSLIGLAGVLACTVVINYAIPAEKQSPARADVRDTAIVYNKIINHPSRVSIPELEVELAADIKPVYTAKSMLSPEELKDILYQVGFRGENLREAWGTAMKESTGRPMAHNDNPKTGDNSYGLFQINMIGDLGPARLDKYGLESNEDLFDPLTNAKIAFQMSNGGKDWSAWHGLTDRTLEWMAKFPNG